MSRTTAPNVVRPAMKAAAGVLLASICAGNAVGDEPPPARSIVIAAGEGPFVFGRTVSLEMSYRNEEKEPWVVPTPTESTSVWVRRRPTGSEQQPWGYSLGHTLRTEILLPDGQKLIARMDPEPSPLTIAPGQAHDFQVAFQRTWIGDIVPGRWTVWIEDRNVKIESNRLEMQFRFTADSVEACLEIAADKSESVYKRFWHSRWLQRIDPDLKLIWPARDASDEVKAQRETAIQQRLQEFSAFWKKERDSPELVQRIAQINREAGLERAQEPSNNSD